MNNGSYNLNFTNSTSQKINTQNKIKFHTGRKTNQITSFKQIKDLHDPKVLRPPIHLASNRKHLENQQNYQTSQQLISHTPQTWKNSEINSTLKKLLPQAKLFKSPDRFLDISRTQSKQNNIYLNRQPLQNKDMNSVSMTPCIQKINNSFNNEELNKSYLTENNNCNNSQNISSSIQSKNSYSDCQSVLNQSCEEDSRNDRVNSSIQIDKNKTIEAVRSISQFGNQQNYQSMKKSTICYISELDSNKSQTSSVNQSIKSLRFTHKFKQYKKSPKIQDFLEVRQIGSGKYGKVMLSYHIQSGFLCAIKSISKQMIRKQNLLNPFIEEVKIQACLQHPNIVKLYGIFHDSKNIYLIMQYCEQQNLMKIKQKKKGFSQHEIVNILYQLFDAVSFLHSLGIIHRDLKPQNIVVSHNVHKLCDFGWAAITKGSNRSTFCGTPLYVSPEVLKGDGYNDKTDIWGLGVIMYQLVFNRVPFAINNQRDFMKIMNDPVYFPFWGDSEQKFTPYIKRMLNKQPSARPSLNEILASDIFKKHHDSLRQSLRFDLEGLL